MGRPKIPYSGEYRAQKQNARRRGILFEFDYQSWVDWWGDDIVNRGRGREKLVMARYNDSGPYHPDNVLKMLGFENVRDGNAGKIVSEITCKKLADIAHKRWAKEKKEYNRCL